MPVVLEALIKSWLPKHLPAWNQDKLQLLIIKNNP